MPIFKVQGEVYIIGMFWGSARFKKCEPYNIILIGDYRCYKQMYSPFVISVLVSLNFNVFLLAYMPK